MPDPYHIPAVATITGIRMLSADTSLFRLHCTDSRAVECFASFVPGQFIQLSVPGGGEIPISPADIPGRDGSLELCVRRVGHVTELLHAARQGDPVGLRGPFGVGFPVEEMAGGHILLLAGGLGIAPLRSLLYFLLRQRDRYATVTLMYGAREPAAMLFRDELLTLSANRHLQLMLTVDFASEEPPGELNCAVGLLPDLLKGVRLDVSRTWAAVCGPPPLYRCITGELIAMGIPAEQIFLSLERRMKCGIGRCCHCAVGQLLCCCDGPVFRYSQLQRIAGAI